MQTKKQPSHWLYTNANKLFWIFVLVTILLLLVSTIFLYISSNSLTNFGLIYSYLIIASSSTVLFVIIGLSGLVYLLTKQNFYITNLLYIAKIDLAFSIIGISLGVLLAYLNFAIFWVNEARLILLSILAILNIAIIFIGKYSHTDKSLVNIAILGITGVLFMPIIKYAVGFFANTYAEFFATQINAMPIILFVPILLNIVSLICLAMALVFLKLSRK